MMRLLRGLFVRRRREPVLRQYQLDGIVFMKKRGRVFVDLETDFGKTVMSPCDGWMSSELIEIQARDRSRRKVSTPAIIDLASLEQLDSLIKRKLPH